MEIANILAIKCLNKIKSPLINLITNGDFSNGISGWSNVGLASFSALNKEAICLADAQYDYFRSSILSTVIGHKYYISSIIKTSSNKIGFSLDGFLNTSYKYHSGSGLYEKLSIIQTATKNNHIYLATDISVSGWNYFYVKNVFIIDLTLFFGSGFEPTVAIMDSIIKYYQMCIRLSNSPFAIKVKKLFKNL